MNYLKMLSVFLMAWLLLMTSALARNGRGYQRDNDSFGHPSYGQKQKIQIEFMGQQMRGQNTIFLKREIKKSNFNINLMGAKIVAVKLVAKTKMGRGTAALKVGHSVGYPQIIQGRPYDFHYDDKFSYDKVKLFNPSRSSQGPWQILLKGNFKIKKVVVIIEVGQVNKKIMLRLNGQHLRGQNTIMLKKELKMQNPGINIQEMELMKVKLIAKSKHGGGMAKLKVGSSVSYQERISGTPADFHYEAPFTYDELTFTNPGFGGSQGPWQILLNGNIKVKAVVIELKSKFGGKGSRLW